MSEQIQMTEEPEVPLARRKCKLEGCGVVFDVPEGAPHKRFCKRGHKNAWHQGQMKRARALLKQQEKKDE